MKKRLVTFVGTAQRIVLFLTGGRPMTDCGFAFHDLVSCKAVRYYRDRLGRGWLADDGPWSWFRVERNVANEPCNECKIKD